MLNSSSSSILRRQNFLIRTLLGSHYNNQIHIINKPMQKLSAQFGSLTTTTEADSESILRRITPTLDPNRHKGQAGKVAVIGGCREYTGAPYFAAISALKIGADLSHVFCTKDAAPIIKSYSPELIVHPILEESYSIRDEERRSILSKVLAEVAKWMERFDCIVVGPGLGRDPFLLDCVSEIMKLARRSNVPIVVDGDGLFLVTNNLDLVSGYHLAVLTPNVKEYKRLVQKVIGTEVNDQDAAEELLYLARGIGGTTVLRKGKPDLISDGVTINMVSIFGSPRRCGGQGDILSGRFVTAECLLLIPSLYLTAKYSLTGLSYVLYLQSSTSASYEYYLLFFCYVKVFLLFFNHRRYTEHLIYMNMYSTYNADGSYSLIFEFIVAVFSSWARQCISVTEDSSSSRVNPMVLGCIAASALLRKAASLAFQDRKRATLTTDIIEYLGRSLEDISPAS
ncbi:hypothetical protein MKX01_021849 [Papaver californicum]|nr:hypothetical protein MKX01_021849 [Papaver californicum]